MAVTEMVTRYLRRYILNIESLALFIFLITMYNFLFNAEQIRLLFGRVIQKVDVKFKGFEAVESTTNNDIFFRADKTSWSLQDGSTAVYSIQGRRPHMEDRFNVINNIDNSDISLYGVFDGHGGEVRTCVQLVYCVNH